MTHSSYIVNYYQMNKMNQDRNISLDIARILACIGVITIHTAGGPIVHHMVEDGSIGWALCNIIDACVRWCVPLFVMISGYFFLGADKPIRSIYSKYVLRLVLSLIFWALFYAIILHWNVYPFDKLSGHFWFIGMMIGMYISIPVLRPVAQNQQLLRYSVWVWFGLEIYKFIGRYAALPIAVSDFVFTDYVGYFLLGYYVKSLVLSKRQEGWLYIAALLCLAVTIALPVCLNDKSVFNYESPNVIITTLAIFYFFAHRTIECGTKTKQLIAHLSACSFGIYMVHMFWLVELFSRIHRFMQSPILEIPVCIGAVFAFSWLTVFIIKKIPYINKYIV